MVETSTQERIALGATDIRIPPMGVGALAWGDRFGWGYGRSYGRNDVREAFRVSVAAGVNFIDTAEVYGFGRSERLVGEFAREWGGPLVIATKFFPFPWRFQAGSLMRALRASLRRLEMSRVDLYQMHWPLPPRSIESWMDGLADAVQAGLTRAVGVSNYDLDQTRRAQEALARRGVPLASNQVQFNLLERGPERSGLLQFCRAHNIALIAYSPLAQGILTGKYTPQAPPPGMRGQRFPRSYLERVQPLIALLREIGQTHDKTPGQVALNWTICKGAVPIPGAKNARQAQENIGALGWQLSEEEIARLDRLSAGMAR